MLEYDDEADNGRGDAAEPTAFPEGNVPIAFVFGVNSNKGDSSGATPYCSAMSRPLSSGILFANGPDQREVLPVR